MKIRSPDIYGFKLMLYRVRNKAYHGCRVSFSLRLQSIPLIVYALNSGFAFVDYSLIEKSTSLSKCQLVTITGVTHICKKQPPVLYIRCGFNVL